MKGRRRLPATKESPGLGLEIELPGASARSPITIRDLTSSIRDLLEENLSQIWVTGEISNFRSPGSGHLYFTIKDETATLAAVMFRTEAARIGFALQDGLAVVARGSVTVYESRGQYQLQVAEIRTHGQGTLQQRFDQLKIKLAQVKLFNLEKKRPLPLFPEVVGIVTSLQGAVLQDMRQILQRRAPGLRLLVRGVRVQGPGAAQEIADAIRAFSAEGRADVLIVARGGGSLEDLWAFNEEVVAYALAESAIPTISAVGHETDFTIADFVADLRAPTPSAAAELLTRDWNDWRQAVTDLQVRMDRSIRQVLGGHRRHFALLASSYALREPRRIVRQWTQRLDELRENLHAVASTGLASQASALRRLTNQLQRRQPSREIVRRKAHLVHLAARLRTLGPQGTLDRGYAMLLDNQNRLITQAGKMNKGQPVRVLLSQGSAQAEIKVVEESLTLSEALARKSDSESPSLPKKKPSRKKAGGN